MKKEIKIITNNWGKINPLKVDDYIAVGGYESLRKIIKENNSQKFIDEIKKSGLCGRGGAGFATGDKLQLVVDEKEKEKYFICNFDESEPGTYKDGATIENNPHLLIEGIIILSLMIKAKRAYVFRQKYIRKFRQFGN